MNVPDTNMFVQIKQASILILRWSSLYGIIENRPPFLPSSLSFDYLSTIAVYQIIDTSIHNYTKLKINFLEAAHFYLLSYVTRLTLGSTDKTVTAAKHK